jgi:hypothetical protein
MGHEGEMALRSGTPDRANTDVSRLDIVLHAKGPHRARERYEFDHLAAAIGVRSKLLAPRDPFLRLKISASASHLEFDGTRSLRRRY